ncbi:homeobox domain-containing protein [Rhypophila decipiens]|uniref:Homeobox domain-containing protein n=1 Tax=Rhypophila decipiens TaxID=261697 RepID=A0AAN6YIK2_9PEZI|nr:homeobox domain-containing protein [Rhypophila decipiens]
MTMIMAHPVPTAFKRELAWDDARTSAFTSRPRVEPERIELPSIRTAFPDFNDLRLPQNSNTRPPSLATSPAGVLGGGVVRSPDYIHSPNQNKRRRLSIGDEREDGSGRVPRLYNTSSQRELQMSGSRGLSPTLAGRSATESWTSSSHASPYGPQSGSLPPMREPAAPLEVSERHEARHSYPRLPNLNFDRTPATMPRIRGRSADDAFPDSPGHMGSHCRSILEPGPSSGGQQPYPQHTNYFPYQQPSRVPSLQYGAIHPFDRTPFSPGGYGSTYQEYMRVGELGGMSMSGDNKQRKRRGNLPKETTDKLRAWFVNHLQHPYPTEDEKQDLMRQTGLAMNQISNWFINARRRQLPTMINNARAESDAMSARNASDLNAPKSGSSSATVLTTTERGEYHDMMDDAEKHHRRRRRDSIPPPLSDGEGGSAFDDDAALEMSHTLKRRHATAMNRGSI